MLVSLPHRLHELALVHDCLLLTQPVIAPTTYGRDSRMANGREVTKVLGIVLCFEITLRFNETVLDSPTL